jgi:hypothetical protein
MRPNPLIATFTAINVFLVPFSFRRGLTKSNEHFSHEAATVNEEFPNNLANRAPDFVGQAWPASPERRRICICSWAALKFY